MPSRKNRVTRFTDDRGNVLEEYKGAAEQNAIEKARKAGIPANLLHRAGWNGEEDDVTGFFSDLLYQLTNLSLKGPVDMSDAEPIISALQSVCKSVGVDYREAIDFDYPRFIRARREDRENRDADVWASGSDSPYLDMFGAPSGPEHDSHGHGLSNGHWACFTEDRMSGALSVQGQRISASWLNMTIPGGWKAIPLLAGWANHGNGSPVLQARFLNSAVLQVVGNLNPGTLTNGTTIGVLPSASMYPANTQQSLGAILAGTGAGGTFPVSTFSNGSIQISNLSSGVTYVSVNYLISLDA